MTNHITQPHEVPLKRCNKCEELLPATTDYFHRQSARKDGLRRTCIKCRGNKKMVSPIDSDGNRRCTKCGELKPATPEYFARNKRSKSGITPRCKACAAVYRVTDQERQSLRAKAWNEKNKEHVSQAHKAYYQANKERMNAQNKENYAANKDEINQRTREKRRANIETWKERERAYREKHKEKKNIFFRDYYARNKAKFARYAQSYYRANKQSIIDRLKRWRKTNRETFRAIIKNRKARKRNAQGYHTGEDIKAIYQKQGGLCAYCQCEVGTTYHVDHIFPLIRGGSNWPENLAIACSSCNCSKSDKLLYTEWTPPNPLS